MHTIESLREHSHLPGPRGNLELLYEYARSTTAAHAQECLAVLRPDTANSPDEFVGMCGVLGFALTVPRAEDALAFLRTYACHASWRIREAVAMGIQEIAVNAFEASVTSLSPWATGHPLERRAVVAGLAEPKVLRGRASLGPVQDLFLTITASLPEGKLTEAQQTLRQGLGYAWSVVVAAEPETGKPAFERLFSFPRASIAWVIKENLKKNRLVKMDPAWVDQLRQRVSV